MIYSIVASLFLFISSVKSLSRIHEHETKILLSSNSVDQKKSYLREEVNDFKPLVALGSSCTTGCPNCDVSAGTSGTVMSAPVTLYNIYIGQAATDYAPGVKFRTVVDSLAVGLQNTPNSPYLNILSGYVDTHGKTASKQITYGGSYVYTYASTALSETIVANAIGAGISAGVIKMDTTAMYNVIFRGDSSYCFVSNGKSICWGSYWCGYHGSLVPTGQTQSVIFATMGDTTYGTVTGCSNIFPTAGYVTNVASYYLGLTTPGLQCQDSVTSVSCTYGSSSTCTYCAGVPPNGDRPSDRIISVYIHEVVEAITDGLNGFYVRNALSSCAGSENGDLCAQSYSGIVPSATLGTYNLRLNNGAGGYSYFLTQDNFDHPTKVCTNGIPLISQPPTTQPVLLPTKAPVVVTTPSVIPSSSPSVAPSKSPSVAPSVSPSLTPSMCPSVKPSLSPTAAPSALPTSAPSTSPSIVPSVSPSLTPSINPTDLPSLSPSIAPSASPSVEPSVLPSCIPSVEPSSVEPTVSWEPSMTPSAAPSALPSADLSLIPSAVPSALPSTTPSVTPSAVPSVTPSTVPSMAPSAAPSVLPSATPSVTPSTAPSVNPSTVPSMAPSAAPSVLPSATPSVTPSTTPSVAPSTVPSVTPSVAPSTSPSTAPSVRPSVAPTASPSAIPSASPSAVPSRSPSASPISPTVTPSASPVQSRPVLTSKPTAPTAKPTTLPTSKPSIIPSLKPVASTTKPSASPTSKPSIIPSAKPVASTIKPSAAPTSKPSISPSAKPV